MEEKLDCTPRLMYHRERNRYPIIGGWVAGGRAAVWMVWKQKNLLTLTRIRIPDYQVGRVSLC
jgi:hypothetical protein